MAGVTDPIRNSEGDMGPSITDVHTEGVEGDNPNKSLVEVAWHLYCRAVQIPDRGSLKYVNVIHGWSPKNGMHQSVDRDREWTAAIEASGRGRMSHNGSIP